MDSLKKFIVDCVGEEGYDILFKSFKDRSPELQKNFTNSLGKRLLISFWNTHVNSMDQDEVKQIPCPGQENLQIRLTKKENAGLAQIVDAETGYADPAFQYTDSNIKNLFITVLDMSGFETEDGLFKTEESEKLSNICQDLVSRHITYTLVSRALDALTKKEGEDVSPDLEIKESKTPEQIQKELDKKKNKQGEYQDEVPESKQVDKENDNYYKIKKQKTPKQIKKAFNTFGGAGMPNMPTQPKQPKPAVPASRTPAQSASKQAQQAASGKPVGGKTPKGAKNVKAPKLPKIGKNEYFKQLANQSKTYPISKKELFNNCSHCGLPEFKKTESGVKYSPCYCFSVTLTSKQPFVEVISKSEGFSLKFNPNADKESIQAFLVTLRSPDKQKK